MAYTCNYCHKRFTDEDTLNGFCCTIHKALAEAWQSGYKNPSMICPKCNNPITLNVPHKCPPTPPLSFEIAVKQVLQDLGDMLIAKNAAYGNSALDPMRVFSKAETLAQIDVRLDDKLSRIKRGDGSGNEDAEMDIMGYLALKKVHALINPQ